MSNTAKQKIEFKNELISSIPLPFGNTLEVAYVTVSDGRVGGQFVRKNKYGPQAGSGVLTPEQMEQIGLGLMAAAEEVRKRLVPAAVVAPVEAPAAPVAVPVAVAASVAGADASAVAEAPVADKPKAKSKAKKAK